MKVPNVVIELSREALSLSRLQNEGSQRCVKGSGAKYKSIKATE